MAKILVIPTTVGLSQEAADFLTKLAVKSDNLDHFTMLKESLKQAGVTVDETEGKLTFVHEGEKVNLLFTLDGKLKGVEFVEPEVKPEKYEEEGDLHSAMFGDDPTAKA